MLDLTDLEAHAERVAQKFGAHAGVGLEPGGERVKLSVFRMNGARAQSATFAPDTPDLKARVEQEIPRLAALLAYMP